MPEMKNDALDFSAEAQEDGWVCIKADGISTLFTVAEAVELSFLIMAAATAADPHATETAVGKELQRESSEDEDVCEFGHPIAGDCTTCNAPCCDTDVCESHCEHVT